MAIADTINSIRTHLTADYESLENIGAELENVDKNIENIASCLEEVYNNIPKTTDTGTNLSLNTIKGKMNIIPKGDTEQNGTPTPDTPIDIEVVTGTQEVKVENKNLLNIQTIVKGRLDNGEIGYESDTTNLTKNIDSFSFAISTAYRGATTDFIRVNDNFKLSQTNLNSEFSIQVCCYDKSKAYLGNASQSGVSATGNSRSVTILDNTYYVRIYYYLASAGTITINKPQLEYGSTATSYVEHQEQTQTISLGDIELCKIGNYQDYLYKTSGKNLFNVSTIITGKVISPQGELVNTNNFCVGDYVEVSPNTQYTISRLYNSSATGAEDMMRVAYYDNNKTFISRVNSATNPYTITTPSNCYYLRLTYHYPSNTNIMLNIGSTALPYEPYGSGKWYKKEYIGKVVLNESENWVTRSGGTSYAYAVTNFLPQNASNGLCNYWKFIVGGAGGSQANECMASANTTTALNIFTNNTSLNSVANLKTWLGTNTPIVYFNREVANDIEITNTTLIEQLNNLEKMYSYNGTTNISSSGNLPVVLGVSALKGE